MTESAIWHPFTQHGLCEPMPLVTSAQGACLFTEDGRRIIDAISSWWVTTHGHCHPQIMAAIAAQSEKLDQIIFAGWTHEPAEHVARELLQLLPKTLTRVFFSDSGSTSVEVALKMALGYWRNRGEQRHRLVVMEHGYHGDTVGAMSIGHRGVFNCSYEPLLFDVTTVPFPASGDDQKTLDALEVACRNGAAAFIVEPLVLGAGGMLTYAASILREMYTVCQNHGVVFIADEVMTGWGRTGTLFACEQAGFAPDIICLSKGLTGGAIPLAVTISNEDIYQAHASTDRSTMLFHSSSYTANPLACAAAAANLEIWKREPVLERVSELASRQQEHLSSLEKSVKIHGARTVGTIAAFEVGCDYGSYMSEMGPRLLSLFRERGVLLRPLGNTIYVMPPYSITQSELAEVYATIAEAI